MICAADLCARLTCILVFILVVLRFGWFDWLILFVLVVIFWFLVFCYLIVWWFGFVISMVWACV